MSYFSERKGLKSAFVCAAMAVGLGGFAAYSVTTEDGPNPMAAVFAGIFGLMSRCSFKDYRANQQATQDTKNQSPKP